MKPKYPHLMRVLYSTPWMILPAKLKAMQDFLHIKASGGDISEAEIAEIMAAKRTMQVETIGRIAVVPVFGVLAQRVSMLEESSGGVGCESISAALDTLMADKQVKKIVMVHDSPGGSAYGVDELASKIRAYRDEKPIIGIADSVSASASYYLLSQCNEVCVTPGGQVGSVGCLIAYTDTTEMEKQLGIKTEIVAHPEYKGEFWQALTDESRAELVREVKEYYGKFVSAVAKGRRVTEAKVEKDFGRGRMAMAKEAVEKGMADRVCTLEQLLRRLGAETSAAGPRQEGGETIEISCLTGGGEEMIVHTEPPAQPTPPVKQQNPDEALLLDIEIRRRAACDLTQPPAAS